MSRSAKIPDEIQQEYQRLKSTVARFESKGLYDTAHHTMLKRLLKQYPQLGSATAILEEESQDGE